MNKKSFPLPVVLAALLVGAVIGYALSEAGRSGSPLALPPTAQADEVQALKPRVPEASAKADKSKTKVRRFGQVIGLKPGKQLIYNMLHAHPWKPINKMIKECNIQNYSIYETELDGKLYLFSYFEYTGNDFDADTARMAKDQVTQAWWKLTDPCQIRLPGTPEGAQWKQIPEVYHLD
jgi:L-rhamnose mutarotase